VQEVSTLKTFYKTIKFDKLLKSQEISLPWWEG
jgi:hypothetical protein